MDVRALVVPYDTAQRGVRMGAGPLRLLELGLPAALAHRRGARVEIVTIDVPADPPPAEIRTAFELNRKLALLVADAAARRQLPVILTGNCASAIGVTAGLSGRDAMIAWFDAHADFNTPDTTTSGFLDGTSLATVVGHCWQQLARSVPGFEAVPEARVVLAGARDLDALEEARLGRSGVRRVAARDVPDGLARVSSEAAEGARGIYLHLDLDVLDPADGQVNRFPAPGGIEAGDLVAAIAALGRIRPILAVTLSAYDPGFDPDGRVGRAIVTIAEAAVSAAVAGA